MWFKSFIFRVICVRTYYLFIFRSRLFEALPCFQQLRVLKLGSGSGGVSDVYHRKFQSGLSTMNHLVHFSLTYDCTDEIVEVLRRNCSKTLK